MDGTEGTTAVSGLLFLIWLMMLGGMIIGWVVLVVSAWRAMKAHESIASSLRHLLPLVRPTESPLMTEIHGMAQKETGPP